MAGRLVWKEKVALTGSGTNTFTPDAGNNEFEIAVAWTAGADGKVQAYPVNSEGVEFPGAKIVLTQSDGNNAKSMTTLMPKIKVAIVQGASNNATCTVYLNAAPNFDVDDGGETSYPT